MVNGANAALAAAAFTKSRRVILGISHAPQQRVKRFGFVAPLLQIGSDRLSLSVAFLMMPH
jgi:hypothetical protein